MPLTKKGRKVMGAMKKTYGSTAKAERVFYASANKGTISGVHPGNPEQGQDVLREMLDASCCTHPKC